MAQEYDHESDPDEDTVTLEVDFTSPDAGWIHCRVKPLHDEPAIFCTHICDPFQDLLSWLEQIATGAVATTWSVNEEGSVSRLQFYSGDCDLEDDAEFLLHIQTGDILDSVRGARINRRQLIEAFYKAFLAMAESPAYIPREWDFNPEIDWDKLDEDAFDEARETNPFGGLPLQSLRSHIVEQYLGMAPPAGQSRTPFPL